MKRSKRTAPVFTGTPCTARALQHAPHESTATLGSTRPLTHCPPSTRRLRGQGEAVPPGHTRVAHGQAGDRTQVTCQQRASSPCEAASGLSLPLAATTTCLREASRCGISSSWSLTVGQMLGNYLALIQNAQLAEQRGPERQGHLRGHWPETGTPTSTRGYFSLVLSPFSTICAQHTNPDGDVLLS